MSGSSQYVLAHGTTYYLTIVQRNADGSPSLPAGKRGGVNVDFQN